MLLAAAGTFALTMGARQSMGLFVGSLNKHTGLGLASVSLALAFGQLWWGLIQPFACIVADHVGPGRVLAAGFFVCGFHVAFLATHLPGGVESCGLPPQVGAWSLAMLGLFNIVGSIGIGWAISDGRWRMKSMLSLIYAVRGVAVLLFVLAPKTTSVMPVFAAVMGLTFLSTVPLTAGLVARFFGPAHMATLFGFAMVTHQVGGFLGAWLGGKAFEATGGYDGVWYADILLAAAAALIHLPIKEARPGTVVAVAAR